jgi:enoyl-CoA hydratase
MTDAAMDRPPERHRAVTIERQAGVNVICFASPVLSLSVLAELTSVLEAVAAEGAPHPVVLHSVHPRVFLAGADLAEIAALDATSCGPFAGRGRLAVEQLADYPSPTVAAVNGSCSGGGFDLVLACDAIVAGPGASFSHPGIRRGLVTGWSGTTRLQSALGNAGARAALLETRHLDPATLALRTPTERVAENPLESAIARARRLASLDPLRWHLWRTLKGSGLIDRFNASVVHKLLQWRTCHTSNRCQKGTIESRFAAGFRARDRELEEL